MKRKIPALLDALSRLYPEAYCSLDFGHDFELLFATRLAAQCTDARVNIVTRALFARYPSLPDYAQADLEELESIIRPCGFFHTKARDIIAAAQKLLAAYGGRVPDTMEDLLSLPGVGRKTANLMLGELFGKPAVVVDTHCLRLSKRLGLTQNTDPHKVELDLQALLPPDKQMFFCHALVFHGRAVCMARNPQCALCTLAPWCAFAAGQGNSGKNSKK